MRRCRTDFIRWKVFKSRIVTFDEMLNCVPCNKNLWGGGCHFREETIGSLEFGKEVVCEVLAKKNRTGQLKEEQARLMIPSIFHGNAVKLFNLK